MQLSGNTVLITGGASGIGLAMAGAFLRSGSTVLVCGRSERRLREARARHPELHTQVCDVAREEDRQALAQWTKQNFPGLNVLVNNAGIQRDVDFTGGIGDFRSGENELRINLEAPIILSGLFVPQLAGKPGATLINVSSGLGFVPAARMPVYSASKAGLHAYTLAIRRQLAGVGIRVHEIVPPAVDTGLNPEGRARRGGFKPELSPEEFASAVMKGLEMDILEIGYADTEAFIHASRPELNRLFERMNSRM